MRSQSGNLVAVIPTSSAPQPKLLRKFPRHLLILQARQHFNIARRNRLIVGRHSATKGTVRTREARPLLLKLILRLLFIAHTSLDGLVHARIEIERGRAIDLAAPIDVELRDIVRDGNDHLRNEEYHWK